jgi:hypothetical protein
VRIVLDDEQNGVAGLDLQPVVGDVLDGRSARARERGGTVRIGRIASGLGAGRVGGPTYFTGR